jgi:uncharacterized membrane protein YeiH
MKRREMTFLMFAIFTAAIFGGLIGDIISGYLPEGSAKTLFSEIVPIGFDSISVELYAFSFTIGIMFRVNFVSVLFVVLILIYFRWWYV